MGKVICKIVLTGGPCAGKTSALAKIEETYNEKNYKVLIVHESATELISGGIKCFGKDCLSSYDFQKIILKYQLMKEKMYDEVVTKMPSDVQCIIVYDRGLLDNKAYISKEEFNKILADLNLNEIDLMDRYDKVIHLVTAADGASEYYTLSNNSARTETIPEAIESDKKTRSAWMGKTNFEIIDNSSTFEEKLNRVINSINNAIGIPEIIRRQKKYLVDLKDSSIISNIEKLVKIQITQSYLQNSDAEIRLRKRSLNGYSTYYLTKQVKKNNGISSVEVNRRITLDEYSEMLQNNKCFSLQKNRYSFTYKKQSFRLDVYSNDMAILEIEPTLPEVILPPSIKVIRDITNDDNYSNYNIAKEHNGNCDLSNVKVLKKEYPSYNK